MRYAVYSCRAWQHFATAAEPTAERLSRLIGEVQLNGDGYFNGEMQKPGAYYFTIYARFENGAEWKGIERGGSFSRTGTFFLMQK